MKIHGDVSKPLGDLPSVTLPFHAADLAANLPGKVDPRQALYLERIREGDRSPEVDAWLKEAPREALVKVIETTPSWTPEDRRLRHAVIAALIEHHGFFPTVSGSPTEQRTAGLSDAVVLALGDYYRDQGDKRCVSVYEGLLAKRKTKSNDAVPELESLAQYYQKTGDTTKAAETFLRTETYTTDKPMLGNFTVEAARQYMQMGNEKKANEVYEKVAPCGYGWATGMALHDRANWLIARGRHEEARRLLAIPMTGQYAEQIKVATLSLLAESYFETGDLIKSEEYARAVLKQFYSLETPLKGEGLEAEVGLNESWLSWLQCWRKHPVQTVQTQIVLRKQTSDQEVVVIETQTYEDTPLQVSVSLPFVSVAEDKRRHEKSHRPGRERETFWRSFFTLGLTQSCPLGNHDGVVTIASIRYPTYTLQIPLHVEYVGWLQATPPLVFFDQVDRGRRYEIPVTIHSGKPFKPIRVVVDSPIISKPDNLNETTKLFHLMVILEVPERPTNQVIEGELKVIYDLAGEEVFKIPYFALIR